MKKLLFIVIVAVLGLTACGPSPEELVQQGKNHLENGDCEEAAKCFGKAVEKGNAEAMYEIGWMYIDSICIDQDYEAAATWFKHAADFGYPYAQMDLAEMYNNGVGVPRDDEKAAYWAKKVLEQQENPRAQLLLGRLYYYGSGVPKDYKKAAELFVKLADNEEYKKKVARYLYDMYLHGNGVPKDGEKAAEMYAIDYNVSMAEAYYKMGEEYFWNFDMDSGEYIDGDYPEALKWYLKAAELDHADAQFKLAVMYYFGKGVDKNLAESRKWLKFAAENGNANAQYNLGGAYITGEGVPKNIPEGKYWLQKAADQGNEDAKEFLRNLAKAEAMEKEKAAAEAKAKTEAKAKEEARRNAKRTGVFSVGSNKKVIFSKGNLQYQASTKTWRFAEHQWDIIGSENSKISENYSGWIDLFGWGTSGYNGENPWTTSKWKTDYGNGEMDIAGTNYDWGVYNTISNGGGKSWRTLTRDEWVYVFNTRCTSSGIRYAKATVNGVNGVILLPDNWSSSNYSLSNTNKTYASFNSNRISQSDWTNKFESNGAVFLPAAGGRYVTNVSRVGSFGYYWSASYHNSSSVRYVYFEEGGLSPDSWSGRYYGQSVRLVCPAEN